MLFSSKFNGVTKKINAAIAWIWFFLIPERRPVHTLPPGLPPSLKSSHVIDGPVVEEPPADSAETAECVDEKRTTAATDPATAARRPKQTDSGRAPAVIDESELNRLPRIIVAKYQEDGLYEELVTAYRFARLWATPSQTTRYIREITENETDELGTTEWLHRVLESYASLRQRWGLTKAEAKERIRCEIAAYAVAK